MSKCVAIAPGSIANLGPGFDVVAVSLEGLYDRVEVEENSGISLAISGIDADEIPSEITMNSVGIVAQRMISDFKLKGVKIKLIKGIKSARGLGSSGASAAACALAINELYRLNLSKLKLVEYASIGEIASAGIAHADNVAASIFGGFVIVKYNPIDVLCLRAPENLEFGIVIPEVRLTTKEARSILPKKVRLEDMTSNVSGVSMLIAGILLKDIKLIGKAVMMDSIIEPARSKLIPGYEDVKKAALKAGAYGVTIAGSGPSIVAIVDKSQVNPSIVCEAMKEALFNQGINCESIIAKPGPGARIIH